jgi:isopenicillin N synthase-like dioxygenase
MNANAFTKLPIVDISALVAAQDEGAQHVADELGRAAREVGFCYITGHGIPETVFNDLLDATKRFFALPREEKMKVYIGLSRNHRGYVPEGEEVFAAGSKDRKEAFDLSLDLPPDDRDYAGGNPLLGPNQWPALDRFKGPVMRYYHAAFATGRLLMRGFALALGEVSDFFDAYLNKPPSQLRLIHYPFNPTAGDAMGIGAHTDYECLTLLRSTAPGLEVLNSVGQWNDAPPVPGAFVINIGDMLEVWTNGEFVATSHRVRPVKEELLPAVLRGRLRHQGRTARVLRHAGTAAARRIGGRRASVRADGAELQLSEGAAGTRRVKASREIPGAILVRARGALHTLR